MSADAQAGQQWPSVSRVYEWQPDAGISLGLRMLIAKDGHRITCLAEWKAFAPPKSENQWVEGRSAFELAYAWCGLGAPAMPDALSQLLESRPETRGLIVEGVAPEHRIPFDTHGGEPRNADLAFVGRTAGATVAVTIEAKADEPFARTVAETLGDALERSVGNPCSRGISRVQDLAQALLRPWSKGQPHVGNLRYQLLTAVAGSVAYAVQNGASVAVLVIHEFVTNETRDELHARNDKDYQAFLRRLSGDAALGSSALKGPFSIPGGSLFERPPTLLIGKIVTNRRSSVPATAETVVGTS